MAILNTFYAIRQKSTGYFLPKHKSMWRGHTWAEPTEDCIPRLFRRKGHATTALNCWLGGRWKWGYYEDNRMGPIEEGMNIVHDETRNPLDMEVIQIVIHIKA